MRLPGLPVRGVLSGWGGTAYRNGVAFRAYAYGPGAYSAPTAIGTDSAAMKIRLTAADITVSGTPSPGSSVTLALDVSSDPNLNHYAGSSLGAGPVYIGCRPLDLSVDTLLLLSTSGAFPAIFQSYAGILDPNGQATATLNPPNAPGLAGLSIYTAFLTLTTTGAIKTVSSTAWFTIVP